MKLLAGVAAIAAVGGGLSLLMRKRTLRVYNYSYYIDPKVIDRFEELYGVEVIYDEYEAAEEAFAKLRVGGGGYDVIVLANSYLSEAIKLGLVRRLDHSKLPNLSNLEPIFFELPFDEGLSYSVPYMWGTTGIGVNTKFVEDKVEGYAQVFDTEYFLPKYSKKVTMLEEFLEVVQAAKLYLGIDLDDWSEKAVEKVVNLLKAQKPFLAGYWGASQYVPGLVRGRYLRCAGVERWRASSAGGGKSRHVRRPKEGALMWCDLMVIPKGAREVDLAYAWINYMLEPEVAAANTACTCYPNPLKRSLVENMLSPEILENPAIYPPSLKELRLPVILDVKKLKILEYIATEVRGG